MPARKPSAMRVAPKAVSSSVAGMHSVEQLHHFQCGTCHKWWSIGDAPRRSQWFCPWCGRENRFD